jgi:hypothetical protein
MYAHKHTHFIYVNAFNGIFIISFIVFIEFLTIAVEIVIKLQYLAYTVLNVASSP